MYGKMKVAGVSAGVALAACVLAPGAFADDTVGVMRVEAGTNGLVEVDMPFAPMSDVGPLGYVAGLFCGDGGEFSDMLFRQDALTGDTTGAVWCASAWLDPATGLPSFMPAQPGDTLCFVRTDAGEFDFSAFGRFPSLASPSNGPAFSSISVDPVEGTVLLGALPCSSPYDLLSAEGTNAAAAAVSPWFHLAHVPASSELAWSDPLPLPGLARLYMVSDATCDTDGDCLSDALETLVYGTSPLLADTDGDGIPDGREVACGTDPLVPDPQSSIQGLRAEFRFTTDDLVDIPDFSGLEPFAVSVVSAVSYSNGSWPAAVRQRGDYFACRISGFVFVPVAGLYTFYVTSDDGSRLVVDGTRVVHSPGSHGAFEKSGSVMLEAGWRPLELAYYENIGSAVLSLAWKGPGFPKQAIPAASLCHVPENLAPVVSLSVSQGPYVEGQAVVLSASVRDVDGEIASASLYDGDTLLSSIAGESLSLTVPEVSPGAHSFRVVATDSQGASSERTVEITVEPLPAAYEPGLASAYYAFTAPLFQMPDVSGLTPVGTGIVRRIYFPLSAGLWEGAPEGLTNRYAAVYSGALMVREPGVYTITLRSDDGSQLLLDGSMAVDNGGSHSIKKVSASVTLSAGLHELRLEYFENIGDAGLQLSWTRPDGVSETIPPACLFHAVGTVDSDGDGMPDWWEEKFAFDPADPSDAMLDPDGDGYANLAEFHAGTNPNSPDTDADGMPDAWELANGTVAFVNDALADPDGDGLVNVEEMRHGTNPLLSDTDGDGLTDYEESAQLGTDPTVVDNVQAGSAATASPQGGHYVVEVAEPQPFMVTAGLLHEWRDYALNRHSPVASNRIVFRVDGHYVAYRDVPFDCSNVVHAVFYTPVLPVGSHDISVEWCSPDFRARADLVSFSLNGITGVDRAAVVRRRNAAPGETVSSRVSPAFVEGTADFPWLVSASGFNVRPSGGRSWFVDVPLSSASGTVLQLCFEGLVSTNVVVAWEETDLFSGASDVLLRCGASLLFAGIPSGEEGGSVTVFTNGESACSYSAGASASIAFDADGDYLVHAVWTPEDGLGNLVSDAILVKCAGGSFPAVSPACLVGVTRAWTCPGLSTNLFYEADVYSRFSMATNGVASLLVGDTRGERYVAARLYEGGPVLDVSRLCPMWAVDSFGNEAYLVDSSDDVDRCRCYMRQYGASESVSFQVKTYTSSVLLDDYSTGRWIGQADFDREGVAWFEFFKPKSMASPCHSVRIYQGDMCIGEAAYGNAALPEELR